MTCIHQLKLAPHRIGFNRFCLFSGCSCSLSGCVPLPLEKRDALDSWTIISGTQITGFCPTQRLEIEAQQRKAMDLLATMFYPGPSWNGSLWQLYINQTLEMYPTLSGFYGEGKLEETPTFAFTDPYQGSGGDLQFTVKFESINGAFYITEIFTVTLNVATPELIKLLPQTPYLRSFMAGGDEGPQQPFPTELAAVAPSSLKIFSLTGMNLCCRLPEEWSSWDTIEELAIRFNAGVTGPLPNWVGMKSLKFLDLQWNGITGTLPASYGSATWSKSLRYLRLQDNRGLSGTIPGAWSTLAAKEINLDGTNVTGCVPDQLVNTVRPLRFARCSRNNTELLALKALKGVIDREGTALQSWQEDPSDFTPDPTEGDCCCSNQIDTCVGLLYHASLWSALLHIVVASEMSLTTKL